MPRIKVKPLAPEEEVPLVEHLDELRSRIIVCIVVLVVAFAFCFWQSDTLLDIASKPLPPDHDKLITFGVTEPFTTTVTVSMYAALVLAMPIILWQLYAYILPAFSQRERGVILPLLIMIPVLFLVGVVFAYYLVMPAATKFLLGFNDQQFNIQVRASNYYSFFAMTMLAGGIVFQLPVGILAVTRLGLITPQQLSANRRYAYVVIAVVAAALPGVDPISMILEMLPLLALFELSVILARAFGTPASASKTEAAGSTP